MTTSVKFEQLYQAHYVRVFGLCRRLLNSAPLAEEATQEAFMRAYQKFSQYDPSQSFWSWVAAIANNYCIDLLRRKNRSQNIFDDDASEFDLAEISTNQTALNILIQEENSTALNTAIASLPDKYRIPLVLAYLNEASYDEIAEALAISRNHVGILLLRAKQKLREYLSNAPEVTMK